MSISTEAIKELRQATGAGILDCKKALQETDGNIDEAIEFLRKKGLAAASKKASREANEGLIEAYINESGDVGVLLEVNCETDFVARTEDFQEFVTTLVKQVADNPELTDVESLMAAPYAGEPDKTVQQYLKELIARLGENIVPRQLVRFAVADEDGLLDSYIHIGGRVGVLLEVESEAEPETFSEVAHDISLQIAAASPRYTTVAEIALAEIEAEKDVYRAQLVNENKPDNIKERIIEGKLKKWHGEIVLLEQEFVKDSSLTIGKLLKQHGKEIGSDVNIKRFARFELGTN